MIGTSFLRVAAHDDDYSTNAAITYSMSEEQPEYLRVNPLTGWIYVNQPISQVSPAPKSQLGLRLNRVKSSWFKCKVILSSPV